MKKVLALSVVAVFCLAVVALAGEEKKAGEKKMGGKATEVTILKIDQTAKSFTAKGSDEKEITFYWNDSTKVEGELKEGEKAHVYATEKDGKMWATRIHVEMKKM